MGIKFRNKEDAKKKLRELRLRGKRVYIDSKKDELGWFYSVKRKK